MAVATFVNEIGNSITVEVVAGDPQKLCRIAIIGPESAIESYLTPLELEMLGEIIAEELRQPLLPEPPR